MEENAYQIEAERKSVSEKDVVCHFVLVDGELLGVLWLEIHVDAVLYLAELLELLLGLKDKLSLVLQEGKAVAF